MLKQLRIRNFILINDITLAFHQGFNVITGETGSGKSLLIQAINLLAGERLESSPQRESAKEKTLIEGIFILNENHRKWFNDNDLDYDTETCIRREFLQGGKSRTFINDTPAGVKQLKELMSGIINIHSQHDHLSILKPPVQLDILDAFAGNNRQREQYGDMWKTYTELNQEITSLKDKRFAALKDQDYTQFLLTEIETCNPDEEKDNNLEEKYRILQHTEKLISTIRIVHEILESGEINAQTLLFEAYNKLGSVNGISDQLDALGERLHSLRIELEDIVNEVYNLSGNIETDPHEMAKIEDRMQQINHLLHKHRLPDIPSLLKKREALQEEINEAEVLNAKISETEIRSKQVYRQLESLAEELTQKRKEVALPFSQEIQGQLRFLGMPHATFHVSLHPLNALNSTGSEEIRFLFSANKGNNPQDIRKAGSGGELSRITLCIKAAVATRIFLPALILDEIDTGISGETAGKVGKVLAQMGKNMQLIAISHLPQVAACANNHFLVFKNTEQTETITGIKKLNNEDERIKQIAHMISNSGEISDNLIQVAKELMLE